ncbi:MAG: alkaline phosphatase family protein, partial [Pseudobdellovibrio sp.]
MFLIFILIAAYALLNKYKNKFENNSSAVKLYWFIPDGLRAEEDVFKIYEWAQNGELPHIAELMKKGSYGFSRPVFPSHTPTNFATLVTGEYPAVHGVADGAMRHLGYPLSVVLKGGFSSSAKKVPSIWNELEADGNLVSLLSIPGSTPPDLSAGVTIKGRWGGWGADVPSLILHSTEDEALRNKMIGNKNVFGFGSELTRFTNAIDASGWQLEAKSYSKKIEIDMSNWDQELYSLFLDNTDDGHTNYDQIIISENKKDVISRVKINQWSDWLPIKINWKIKDPQNKNVPQKNDIEMKISAIKFDSSVKVKVIKLGNSKSFRIRMVYNNLNEYIAEPSWVAKDMVTKIGPMVDFVDNYPPQLVYFDEDKDTFMQEAQLSFDWHRKAVAYLTKDLKSNIVLHSIYSPNQMLTSRWWMPYLDPQSAKYHSISETERLQKWAEVKKMYKNIDDIIGEIMKNADSNTYIVLSSDHGALPLDNEVLLNNLFAAKGWLKYKFNKAAEEYEIDWQNSQVVFLQMDNIYINPKGLGGVYYRASGDEYEKLRSEVAKLLLDLQDPATKTKVISGVWYWEDAGQLKLPTDKVGDLIVSNTATYSVIEDITRDQAIIRTSIKGGYKQAILSENKGLLTPFIISGPNIKENYKLDHVINHVEQFHLLMNLLSTKETQALKSELYKQVYK